MKRLRHSVWAPLAAGLFALVAAALFVLGTIRLSGDTVGMSLAIAAASALSAFGFLVQWRKRRREE